MTRMLRSLALAAEQILYAGVRWVASWSEPSDSLGTRDPLASTRP